MRVPLLVLAVVALWVTPLAIADTPPPPPDSVVLVEMPGDNAVLSWTPVLVADTYAIYRGSNENNMALLATTKLTSFFDDASFDGAIYGVATTDAGTQGPLHVVSPKENGKGDCVAANTNLHLTVTISNCLRN